MAQQSSNGNNAPPVATGSMGSADNKNNNEGTGESRTSSQLVATAAGGDKGKGVDRNDAQGASQGNSSEGDSSAATHGGRAGGRRRLFRGKMHIYAERERRQRMKDMFSNLQELVPNLPPKADKASIVGEAIGYIRSLEEMVADLERRKREKDLAAGGRRGLVGASSSLAAAPPLAPAQAVLPVAAHGWSMPMASTQVVLPPAGAHAGNLAVPTTVAVSVPPPPAAAVTADPAPNVVVNWCSDGHAFITISAPRPSPRHHVLTMIMTVLDKHSIDVVAAQIDSDDSRSKFRIHTRVNRERGVFISTVTTEEIYQLAVSEIMVWLTS